jgi:hypothetical protein
VCDACLFTAHLDSGSISTIHTLPQLIWVGLTPHPTPHTTPPVGRPLLSPKTQLPMGPALVPCHNVKALVAEFIDEQRTVIRRRRREKHERQKQEQRVRQQEAAAAAAVSKEGKWASFWGSWFGM